MTNNGGHRPDRPINYLAWATLAAFLGAFAEQLGTAAADLLLSLAGVAVTGLPLPLLY
ncbi:MULTISPECIES: hypothetical protein [unclassified Pseudarthrobacter]|uniref:hypothetical protein n=1 Tax=unclassified Pseudarthrobacter TaxID=2647000 RepID=UPI003077DDC2